MVLLQTIEDQRSKVAIILPTVVYSSIASTSEGPTNMHARARGCHPKSFVLIPARLVRVRPIKQTASSRRHNSAIVSKAICQRDVAARQSVVA
jgi:hypothetical protein